MTQDSNKKHKNIFDFYDFLNFFCIFFFKNYCEKVKIPLKDVEKGNVISDRGLLEIFENVATHHSDMLNDGVNEISKKEIECFNEIGKEHILVKRKILDERNRGK